MLLQIGNIKCTKEFKHFEGGIDPNFKEKAEKLQAKYQDIRPT